MSAVPEMKLKVPTLFRCAVPIVILDAKRFHETDGSSVTGPEIDIFPVAGDPTKFTWMVSAASDGKTVVFKLSLCSNIDVEVDVNFQLKIQSPGGLTVNDCQFEIDGRILALGSDEWQVFRLGLSEFPWITEAELFEGHLYAHADVTCELKDRVLPPPDPLIIDINSIMEKFVYRKHTDFTLIGADGVPIRTHKLILETVSPVFQAMFATDCQETREGCCTIPDFDGMDISALIACILGADMRAFEFQHLAKMFKLADKYEILQLKKKCADMLAGKMSVEHVVDALMLADQHSAPELKAAGFAFMEKNWKKVILNNISETLRHSSPALYEEWHQHLDSAESGETSRKREAEEAPSDLPSKKNLNG